MKPRLPLLAFLSGLLTATGPTAQVTEIIRHEPALADPEGVVVDSGGNVYFTSYQTSNGTGRVIRVTPAGVDSTIIDEQGDGGGNLMQLPRRVAVDSNDAIYVTATQSDNVFQITSGGAITQILNATGDGLGNTLDGPIGIAVDSSNNVFVVGSLSDNVFRITSGGVVTQVLDASGDGLGNSLETPYEVAVDSSGNAFVTGFDSDNVFKVTPAGAVSQFMDASGDGLGNTLEEPQGIAVDSSDNIVVAGNGNTSRHVFRVSQAGFATRILGSGLIPPSATAYGTPEEVAADAFGNAFVTVSSNNAFRISAGGVVDEIVNATGTIDGLFSDPRGVAAAPNGDIYVTGAGSDSVVEIPVVGTKNDLFNEDSGGGITLEQPNGLTVDASGNLIISGGFHLGFPAEDYVYRVAPGGAVTQLIDETGDGGANTFNGGRQTAFDSAGNLYVVGDRDIFQVTPGGIVTHIFNVVDAGYAHTSTIPGIAVDADQNIYITGNFNEVLRIEPGGGMTTILDSTGDGAGNSFIVGDQVALDDFGNVYASGVGTHNVFRIEPDGMITEIIDSTGDGLGNVLTTPRGLTTDGAGNVFVVGDVSDNVFKIALDGTITEIADITGDGMGNELDRPLDVAVDELGNAYVCCAVSDNTFQIAPDGTVTEIIAPDGAGQFAPLNFANNIAVDADGNVFTSGFSSDNVLRWQGPACSVSPVATFRNGGTNPASYGANAAVIGGTLELTVNLNTTGHASALPFGFDSPFSFALGSGQTLLCFDLLGSGGELLGQTVFEPGPVATFSLPIPNDAALIGFQVFTQAIHAFGVVPFALSNAQDIVIGSCP